MPGMLLLCQDAEIAEQIDRDVMRTHPDMHFFSGDDGDAVIHREVFLKAVDFSILWPDLGPVCSRLPGVVFLGVRVLRSGLVGEEGTCALLANETYGHAAKLVERNEPLHEAVHVQICWL